MNETMNTILNRRSVRNFTREEIPEEILRDLANAALHAPSGMCRKTWKFTVVTNQELIKKLTNAIKEVLSRESYDMYNPTAIIIPSNERDSVWGRDDNACALQNIFLAAKSYNVGSVWINQLNNICDETKIREILNELEIPENHIVYGLAALGYPDPNVEERPYREIGEVNFIK
ncbi:MAG: nitroreductase [Clostridia bacterium]|nr:nitroreductase [Clostridia bacterium]